MKKYCEIKIQGAIKGDQSVTYNTSLSQNITTSKFFLHKAVKQQQQQQE